MSENTEPQAAATPATSTRADSAAASSAKASPSSEAPASPGASAPPPTGGPDAPAGEQTSAHPFTREDIFEALRPIVDPEIRLSIVDLGLVYDAKVANEGKYVEVKMTLTTPMCPYGPMLLTQVQDVVNTLPGVEDAKVTLIWEPPWDPRTMASEYAKDKLNIW
ncbi:MAG TPA: metal-sulfur cluster assembly factor [Planctomycetota bacterium]|jgi:metal-sulfur cluster biosynthetic enzyme|nr:metal-sulfur cluster assembly factor [Planctomycetota bacterium]